MRLTTVLAYLLAWSGITSAVTIKGWAEDGCKGASMTCPNIGAKKCCISYKWNDLKGALSASFSGIPSGASGIGWQSSGNTPCGLQRNHRVGNGCLASNIKVWGTFAGMSWKQAGSKRSDHAVEEIDEKCESSQRVELLTLRDGTNYDVGSMEDGELAELWSWAVNGTDYVGLPSKFQSFRK